MNKFFEALKIPTDRILKNEPMARHTTFRIGGTADFLIFPESSDELINILSAAKEFEVPLTVIGNGSNLLVSDNGIRGAVIAIGSPLSKVKRDGARVIAGAGAILGAVSKFAADSSLSGMEFAAGIPGSIGGAVFMNAGAYGGEMKDIVKKVKTIGANGEVAEYITDESDFGYRNSIFQNKNEIIFEAELELKPGNPEQIRNKMTELMKRRAEKQPLEKPSAGSAFKRPAGYFAAALIEQAGLKGFQIGGASVSEKHAGFIVNNGGATAADVMALIDEVTRRVKVASGVILEPEIKIIR